MKTQKKRTCRTIDGQKLTFVRCTASGREVSEAELETLGLTNETIAKVVGEVSGRISAGADGGFLAGFTL